MNNDPQTAALLAAVMASEDAKFVRRGVEVKKDIGEFSNMIRVLADPEGPTFTVEQSRDPRELSIRANGRELELGKDYRIEGQTIILFDPATDIQTQYRAEPLRTHQVFSLPVEEQRRLERKAKAESKKRKNIAKKSRRINRKG